MENEIQTLKNIRYTLDGVDVHGHQNLAALLGCINALDSLIPTLQEAAERLEQAESKLAEVVNVPAYQPGGNGD